MMRNRTVLAAAAAAFLVAAISWAQGQTAPGTPPGTVTTTTTTVKRGVVVYVSGNTLVTKESDGVTRQHTVPDGFYFQMNGKNVTLADLKPGDQITAVITETKEVTPVTVTKVVKGKVIESSMDSILVQNAKGQLVKYSAKDAAANDVTIIQNGQVVPLSSLKAGDQLTATIVTKYPPQVSTLTSVDAKVTQPKPPPAPAAAPAAPQAVAAAPKPTKLPKTASPLPLAGLVGGLLILVGAGLTLRRLVR